MQAQSRIDQYRLQPHPEGGYFKRTYCASQTFPGDLESDPFPAGRPYATSILYLMQAGDFAAFHRIKSDEIWYYHEGGSMELLILDETGGLNRIQLGPSHHQQVIVPANHWFAAAPSAGTPYTLVSCSVSPGFDFNDHEMAKSAALLALYPQHKTVILQYCRG